MFAMSLTCLVTGLGLAAVSQNYPQHSVALERACGALLVAGLGLLGFGLRLFR